MTTLPINACSTARPLRPLAAGGFAVEMSLPASLLRTESSAYPLAAPLIGARYGLVEDLELRGNVHVGALFSEVIGLDLGVVWHGHRAAGWVPAFHLTGDLSFFTKPGRYPAGFSESNRGAVEIGITTHWEPLLWLWPYLVSEHTLIFTTGDYLGSVMLGVQVWPKQTVAISVETGWFAFNQPTDRWTEPYVGIGGLGAVYFGFGLEYRGSILNPAADEEAEE